MTVKVVDVNAIRARAKMPVLRSVMVEILRNDIPALIAALREAEAERDRLFNVLRYIAGEDVAGMEPHLRERDVARAALAPPNAPAKEEWE